MEEEGEGSGWTGEGESRERMRRGKDDEACACDREGETVAERTADGGRETDRRERKTGSTTELRSLRFLEGK